MRKPFGPLVFVLISAILMAFLACTSKAPVKPGKAIAIQIHAEPVTLDPSIAEDGMALKILSNLYEGLMTYDGDGKLKPGLAQEYEVSADRKTYTFTLRQGLMWSDRAPITVDEWVEGVRRALDPLTAGKLADMLYLIQGARGFNQGKDSWEAVGVKKLDERRIQFVLETPAAFFLDTLALFVVSPVRQDKLKDGKWTIQHPTTGAYKIAFHQPGEFYLLEPNANFWRVQSNEIKDLTPIALRIVQDESTAISLFQTGALDILTRIPTLDVERIKDRVRTDLLIATYYLAFNTRKPPFDQPLYRRAVSGAIDREAITSALGTGDRPARSWISSELEGHIPWQDPTPVFASSLKQARTQLQIQGKAPLPLTMGFDSGSRNQLIAERVQSELKEKLGMKIELQNMDWKTYIGHLKSDPPSMYRMGWLAPFRDPISNLRAFRSTNPNNYTGWKSAEYDGLVDQIERLPSGSKRLELIMKAQRILVDQDAVVVPIYHYVQQHAVSARVEGFKVSPFGVIRFDELRVVKSDPNKK